MNKSLQNLNQSLQKLEELVETQFFSNNEKALKQELEQTKQDYQNLKETSQEVINELNNSIQIIEDYFKKQNANNKNI